MSSTPHMDTMRCKHCDAIIALIPRAAIVGRIKLCCVHCQYENMYYPPLKPSIDEALVISYTNAVPA
jgi:phage FluMu protein Com